MKLWSNRYVKNARMCFKCERRRKIDAIKKSLLWEISANGIHLSAERDLKLKYDMLEEKMEKKRGSLKFAPLDRRGKCT